MMKNTPKLESENNLVVNNLGLVHLCANRFRGKGIDYEDLYSAGCVGLVKASKAFDNTRGVMFSTYAVPVIMGEIKRLFRDGGTVKVSRQLKELAVKINRMREKYLNEIGKELSVSELSVLMKIPESEITEAICAMSPTLSLTCTEEAFEGEQLDIAENAEDEKITDSITIKEMLNSLEKTDRQLIILRYYKGLTQMKTAEILHMTQVQVSRREKKILLMLRKEISF